MRRGRRVGRAARTASQRGRGWRAIGRRGRAEDGELAGRRGWRVVGTAIRQSGEDGERLGAATEERGREDDVEMRSTPYDLSKETGSGTTV